MNMIGVRHDQFARIFNRDNALVRIQNRQKVVQKRRLAGRRRARNQAARVKDELIAVLTDAG